MEFDFTSLAFGGEQHIVAWDAKRIGALKPDDQQNLSKLLDVFGKKSAVAQGLQTPVTDIHRLRNTDQRLYLYTYRQSSKTVVLGGLKVGSKRLYIRTISAELREIEPVCVLDFYVHESCQRQGVGKALFEHFIHSEGCDPACVAYDRPSPKLLAFLRKHYDLQEYVPQSNNYVVFNRYFEINPTAASGSRSSGGRLNSRGSVVSVGTPHIHPLHGPRSTPPPQLSQPPGVHPGWAGANPLSAPSPSASGPPPPLGQSPSFGRRWAASTFGSTAAPYPTTTTSASAQEAGGQGACPEGGYRHNGDSLDAFSRAHIGGQQQQQQAPYQTQTGRQLAPWEMPAGFEPGSSGHASGAPPASRGNYSTRPPWAVDEGAGAGSSGQVGVPGPMYGTSPARPASQERMAAGTSTGGRGGSQMAAIMGGSGGRDGGGSGGGPHAHAQQQQQLAAVQMGGGAAAAAGYGPMGGGAQQQWATGPASTPGAGGRGGAPGGDESARGAARIQAVAQRSGAGAADCLVW